MDILTLVPDLKAPSCRFRVLQYVKPLSQRRVELEVTELPKERGERRKLFRTAGDFDAVFLHRRLLGRRDYGYLREKARLLIYDFDDAVMFRDSNTSRLISRRRAARFRRLSAGADLVLAGNSYLAKMAAPFSHNVVLLPTGIDLDSYPSSPVRGRGEVIGWMGSGSNFIYLDLLREVLPALREKRPGCRFQVVSDGEYSPSGLQVINKRWTLSGEVEDLLGFDLGIMPLKDDAWTRGKCAFKIIQYFAAFLPVVCSPVGTNRELVEEGVSGYFARNKKEWINRIAELLSSPERREEMGRAGRRRVEEKYSLSVMVPKMAEILKAAVK